MVASMLLLPLNPQNPLTTIDVGEELVHLAGQDHILTLVLIR